jgi:hypothetical protein
MSYSNLNFFTEPCTLDLDPYQPPREGILSSTWMSENTLVIEGYVKEACDGATFTGEYSVTEDRLILTYKVNIGEVVTPCLCTHKIIYKISGLERQNYSISLRRE